jgi:L-alanine-DL-glutamate epimerase-like enolase superfamily enzyme
MQIAAVEAFPLRYPEPHDSGRPRCVTLVRVRADDGLEGWGECVAQWPEAALAVVPIVERGFAELLVGQDPLRIAALWDRMRAHSFWYGNGGIASFAISAIDMALWDLKGKTLGVPVYELLGGRRVEHVRACASVIFDTVDLGATRDEFAAYRDRGYTAVKGGWGRSPQTAFGLDPVRDEAVVRTVREAVGPDVGIAMDVGTHVRWSATHAIEMTRRLAEYDLLWLEEPLAQDDVDGYRRLRAATTTPIATGEKEWTVAAFHALITAGVVDIVMPDPGRAEGLSGFKAVVDDAARAGLRFTPHSWSSAVNTAAALHAFVASPNGVVFELKPHPSPMQHELVAEPFEQRDGHVVVPDRPGLGVEIDPRAVKRYRWA